MTFRSSYYKAKCIKLLVEELPTVQFLQHTSPHLYDATRDCIQCSAEESFAHVWTCSLKLPIQHQVISSFMQHLVQYFSVICPTVTSQHLILIQLFAHPTWQSLSYHPLHFTFIDFIKGLIPTEFVNLVQSFTKNGQLTAEICLNFLHEVFITSQKLLWLPRCFALIEQDRSKGISRRQKLS